MHFVDLCKQGTLYYVQLHDKTECQVHSAIENANIPLLVLFPVTIHPLVYWQREENK